MCAATTTKSCPIQSSSTSFSLTRVLIGLDSESYIHSEFHSISCRANSRGDDYGVRRRGLGFEGLSAVEFRLELGNGLRARDQGNSAALDLSIAALYFCGPGFFHFWVDVQTCNQSFDEPCPFR